MQKNVIEYGIIGLGRFGYNLATTLAELDREVIVVDCDESKIRQIKNMVDEAFVVKNLDRETLEETGIQNCKTVMVGVSKELDVSILTTLTLINLGIPRIIAKATSYEHGCILEKLGAEVVYPEKDMAIRLGHRLSSSKSVDFLKLNGDVTISEFKVPSAFVGKSITEIKVRQLYSLNVIAIENEKMTTTDINPEYVFKEDDLIVLVGSNKNMLRFEKNIIKKDRD